MGDVDNTSFDECPGCDICQPDEEALREKYDERDSCECSCCDSEGETVEYADEPETKEEPVKAITVTTYGRTFSFTKAQAIGLLLADAAVTAATAIAIFSLFVK